MLRKLSIFSALALASCASSEGSPVQSSGFAITALEEQVDVEGMGDYRIGATDVLNVTVFQVESLTFEKVRVDAAGMLQMPLIGDVRAAGKTPSELSREIADRLRNGFIRDPQVSVTVEQAASQKITVDGAVKKPGVYEMRGRTTLLQALAMAEGPTRVADLQRVAVFRTVEGRRMAAVFDMSLIRSGQAADPYLDGNDIVIVDTSRLSQTLQDVLLALPGLAVFSYL